MKKDLDRYIVLIQKQSTALEKAMKDANEEYKAGRMTEELKDYIVQQASLVKTNYDRLMYCKYLVELPPKFLVRLGSWLVKLKLKKATEEMTDEAEPENKEALEKIDEAMNGRTDS